MVNSLGGERWQIGGVKADSGCNDDRPNRIVAVLSESLEKADVDSLATALPSLDRNVNKF